jgi:hypothetical protein
MNKHKLFLFLFLFFLIPVSKSFSQGALLTQPRLEPNGNHLNIFYDIITKHSTDQFYIWVEIMKKSNGEIIQAKSLSGDIGENVKAGTNKKIIWSAEQDSIYLNEDIVVEVKAEKYTKSFNKSTVILKSVVLPGWGQASISGSKSWWLASITAYGTLTGGYIYHKKYLQSYESYKAEPDPLKRQDLLKQTQNELSISTIMLYTSASVWAANILWVAFSPCKYQPLKHTKLSINSVPDFYNGGFLFSLKLDF